MAPSELDALLELAIAPSLFDKLKPGEELVADEDCHLFFGHGTDARSSCVQGLRPPALGLHRTVERVRELARRRGRSGVTWEVVTPPLTDRTVDELTALGLQPSSPPVAVIMALTSPPRASPASTLVTAVDTIDEYRVHVSLTHEIFKMTDRLPATMRHIDAHGADDVAERSFVRYVARVEGEPAGASTATFAPGAVMLHSGSTLERLRNRGVYSAMVAHRWNEAVRRGTPRVVTRAGPMSRPILEKLGFRELGLVHFLTDTVQ